MLILHTAESYPPSVSGIPEVVSQLSERLARRGHEVHVATSAIAGAPALEVLNGVTVHRFPILGNEVKGIRGDVNPYLEFVRSKPWDVVASHCSQVWCTDLLFEEKLPAPSVFVAHGLSAFKDPTYKDYFKHLGEWLRGKTMVSLSSTGVEDGAFLADNSLPPSEVIVNGIDPKQWVTPPVGVRKKWGWADTPWLLNVSTHNPAKAHHRLFELMDLVTLRKPSAHMTQIGRSHPAHKYNLGKFGVKGGCYYDCMRRSLFSKSVNLMFGVSRVDTVSAMKEADMMVLTSDWEASPLVILECMAAGVPFVTFDVGCVREHVGGRVVESLPEMANTVIELLDNPELRADLGAQGKARIAERHSWEVVVNEYEAMYRRLIDSKGGSV